MEGWLRKHKLIGGSSDPLHLQFLGVVKIVNENQDLYDALVSLDTERTTRSLDFDQWFQSEIEGESNLALRLKE